MRQLRAAVVSSSVDNPSPMDTRVASACHRQAAAAAAGIYLFGCSDDHDIQSINQFIWRQRTTGDNIQWN